MIPGIRYSFCPRRAKSSARLQNTCFRRSAAGRADVRVYVGLALKSFVRHASQPVLLKSRVGSLASLCSVFADFAISCRFASHRPCFNGGVRDQAELTTRIVQQRSSREIMSLRCIGLRHTWVLRVIVATNLRGDTFLLHTGKLAEVTGKVGAIG